MTFISKEPPVLVNNANPIVEIKFTCIICKNSHGASRMYEVNTPICHECLSDLSEIILEKRGNDSKYGEVDVSPPASAFKTI